MPALLQLWVASPGEEVGKAEMWPALHHLETEEEEGEAGGLWGSGATKRNSKLADSFPWLLLAVMHAAWQAWRAVLELLDAGRLDATRREDGLRRGGEGTPEIHKQW